MEFKEISLLPGGFFTDCNYINFTLTLCLDKESVHVCDRQLYVCTCQLFLGQLREILVFMLHGFLKMLR